MPHVRAAYAPPRAAPEVARGPPLVPGRPTAGTIAAVPTRVRGEREAFAATAVPAAAVVLASVSKFHQNIL